MPPTARPGFHVFLFNDLGTHSLPEVVDSRVGSLGVETSAPRSDPEDPSDPAASVPPFVCGASPVASGIYDEGCFGCVGIGRISRIASETGLRGSATSQDLCSTASGGSCVPRSLNKERTDRKPPSEASLPAEQIREHRRNRCPKSALGPAVFRVWKTIPDTPQRVRVWLARSDRNRDKPCDESHLHCSPNRVI